MAQGTAQVFPVVGASLSLSNPLPTSDAADGQPGATAPSTAIQVAGSDGTDLRTVYTDTLGRIIVVGAESNGTVLGGNPVLLAGSDGYYVRTLDTDSFGQLKILVENSPTVVAQIEGHAGATLDAAPGSALPINAVLVGGSDGTDIQAIATDTNGQVKTLVENSVNMRVPQTPAAPNAVTVTGSSSTVVSPNPGRTGLVLINTSLYPISIAFGNNGAVLNSGIVLGAGGGTFEMDAFTFFLGSVNAIGESASCNLAIQEFS